MIKVDNKELKEAVEWLKNNIKYYQEQLKIISALDDSDYYDEETKLYENRIKIFKTVLNHIENSISKEVIEEKIEELKEGIKRDMINYDKVKDESWKMAIHRSMTQKIETKKVLQQLLEGK